MKPTDDKLLHRVYDGIEEHDNHLPNWWLGILWGTVVFALGYWLYFHTFAVGRSLSAELTADVAALQKRSTPTNEVSDESLLRASKDPAVAGAGAKTFQTTCAACHGVEGQGTVGPNLTDRFWIHGKGSGLDIYRTVSNGVIEKGMPAWSATLGDARVREVAAYVLTLRGKNVAGKAPQGEPAD